MSDQSSARVSRRKLLGWGVGVPAVLIGGAIAGIEVDHSQNDDVGVLTGPSVPSTTAAPCDTVLHNHLERGPTYWGKYFSTSRNRTVWYTLAYPPGHVHGDLLPLAVYLHAYGGSYASRYGGYPLAAALALGSDARSLRPMAMICASGGDGYWHPRHHDDPMRMIVDEIIPMCRRIGLGRGSDPIVVTGIEMGGYGALLLAERYPDTFSAAAAISPTIWTDYDAARRSDPKAFPSEAQFRHFDVIRHAGALAGRPVQVMCGQKDPFRPSVERFVHAAGSSTTSLSLVNGAHGAYAIRQEVWPSLQFLSSQLPIPAKVPPPPTDCPSSSA